MAVLKIPIKLSESLFYEVNKFVHYSKDYDVTTSHSVITEHFPHCWGTSLWSARRRVCDVRLLKNNNVYDNKDKRGTHRVQVYS